MKDVHYPVAHRDQSLIDSLRVDMMISMRK